MYKNLYDFNNKKLVSVKSNKRTTNIKNYIKMLKGAGDNTGDA